MVIECGKAIAASVTMMETRQIVHNSAVKNSAAKELNMQIKIRKGLHEMAK